MKLQPLSAQSHLRPAIYGVNPNHTIGCVIALAPNAAQTEQRMVRM
jgi:hypothetical protein